MRFKAKYLFKKYEPKNSPVQNAWPITHYVIASVAMFSLMDSTNNFDKIYPKLIFQDLLIKMFRSRICLLNFIFDKIKTYLIKNSDVLTFLNFGEFNNIIGIS